MHIDCDIYASTKTALEQTIPRLAPGAVIVFDEFFNYKGYELHEYKASSKSPSASTSPTASSAMPGSRWRSPSRTSPANP